MADEGKEKRSRRDVEAQLIAKAWADEAFVEELRTDPRAAVEKELGVPLPEGVTVEVHEEKPEHRVLHLVIPPKPVELSEEELDAVAGGSVGGGWCGDCSRSERDPTTTIDDNPIV